MKQYYYSRTGNSLVEMMQSSIYNHGGTEYQANMIPSIIDSFLLNGFFYRPFINIPLSDEVNLTQQCYMGASFPDQPSGFKVVKFSNYDTVVVTSSSLSFVQTNPIWIVNLKYRNNDLIDWVQAMHWMRCGCMANDGTGSPDPTDPHDGVCKGPYLGKNCGRSNFWGTCPGTDCQMDASFVQNELDQFNRLIFN